jgi:hypothetical protein
MDRRKFPGIPDDLLPMEVPDARDDLARTIEREDYDPEIQRPFASIPNLIKYQPNPMVEVTNEDVARIKTTSLTKVLYGKETPRDEVKAKRTVDGVALNPKEYGKIAIHLPTLLERAEAPASSKYANANPIIKREHELKRRLDTLDRVGPQHESIIEGLTREADNLKKLMTYARRPGLRRAKDAQTRIMATMAWGSITNLVDVVGDKSGWTPDERASTKEAMFRALTTGPQNVRMSEWKRVLPIAYDYTRRKNFIFQQRADVIKAVGTQVSEELTGFLAEHGFSA